MIIIDDVHEARALANEIKEVYFVCHDYKKAFSEVVATHQLNRSVFKVGDEFINNTSKIMSKILSISGDKLILSQKHNTHGYYKNLAISKDVLNKLLLRGCILRRWQDGRS